MNKLAGIRTIFTNIYNNVYELLECKEKDFVNIKTNFTNSEDRRNELSHLDAEVH